MTRAGRLDWQYRGD